MSELIAEARVLVTPDTTGFRSLLIAQTTAASKGVTVPIQVTPVVTGAGNTSALAAQSAAVAAASADEAAAVRGSTEAKKAAISTNTAYTKSLKQVGTGAGSAAASLLGVRGATLAATGPFLAGAAGAIALGRSLAIATSFNSEIATLGAVTDATGAQLERAAEAARQFGADISLPGVTASDAAVTITAFSKAGLDLEDSIAATRGGLQLAQAAQLSFTDAVELSAGALNAFNLEGNQAVHVADVLANASNLAQGGITDTALALRQAASAAEVVGVSFEDTAALLTLLARNGLTGSDAGTALRTSFLRLVNPSKEAAAVIRSLNVQLRDAQGNVRPEIFAEFAEAQRGLSVATQQANAAIVFGQDAFRAFGILGQEGAAGLAEVQGGLEKTGTAAELARARMTGLAGAQENLSNQLNTSALALGQFLTPFATGVVNTIALPFRLLNAEVRILRGLLGEDFDIDTASLGDLRDRLEEINREADHFRESGGFVPPRLQNETASIVAEIEEIGKAMLATSAGVTGFVDLFTGISLPIAKALRDGVITPSEEAALAVTDIGRAFLNIAPGKLFSGGFSTIKAELEGVKTTFQNLGADIANSFFDSITITSRRAGKQVGADMKQIVVDIGSQLSVDLAVAQAAGNENAELAVLRQREQRQEAFLDAVLGREKTEKNLALAEDAAQNLDRTRASITAIVEGNAADAKRAADEQRRIAADADQAFLVLQDDSRARQERLVGLATETEGLQDDIKRRQVLRTLITQQIQAIRESGLAEKTKREAIKALVAEKQATSDQINRLVRTQAEQNREQREAAQEERESAQIALGESILDLTGNKNPLLRALDAAVKDAIKERNAAKKGSLEFTKAQTEINNLLKRRKDVLEDADESADDAVGGTSLVDLFNQAQDILGGAGNVGFNAQGLQNLSARPRIQMEVQQRLDIVNDPAAARAAKQQQSTDRLIAAIDQLTNAITGNSTTGTVVQGPQNRRAWKSLTEEQRFYFQRQAKQMVEQGLVG